MSDNKPTPGPWRWRDEVLYDATNKEIFCLSEAHKRFDRQDIKNLIAAAPDLLAACEAALPWFEDAKGSGKRDGDLLRDAIKNAKAAL